MSFPKLVSVPELNRAGYHVKVQHYRTYWTSHGTVEALTFGQAVHTGYNHISNNGGITKVILTDKEGNKYEGVSVCSDKDQFCKRKGISIAAGRALRGKKVDVVPNFDDYNGIVAGQ